MFQVPLLPSRIRYQNNNLDRKTLTLSKSRASAAQPRWMTTTTRSSSPPPRSKSSTSPSASPRRQVLSVCSGYFSGLFAKASFRYDTRHVYPKNFDPSGPLTLHLYGGVKRFVYRTADILMTWQE